MSFEICTGVYMEAPTVMCRSEYSLALSTMFRPPVILFLRSSIDRAVFDTLQHSEVPGETAYTTLRLH